MAHAKGLLESCFAVMQACNPLGGVESCMTLPSDSKFAEICPGHDLKVWSLRSMSAS